MTNASLDILVKQGDSEGWENKWSSMGKGKIIHVDTGLEWDYLPALRETPIASP